MSSPKVSIALITYNHAEYIEQCLDSILAQKVDFPIEIVIGEDAGTDSTREICEQYANDYPEIIRLLPATANMGMQRNYIRTIQACKGQYIALTEGDDYWTDSDKLKYQAEVFDRYKGISLCFHEVALLQGEELKEDIYTNVPGKESTIEDLAVKNYIHTTSCMFRNRTPFEFPDYYTELPVSDYPLHMLNAKHGNIYYIEKKMAVYRIHENGIWANKSLIDKRIQWLDVVEPIISDHEGNVRAILKQQYVDQCLQIAYQMQIDGDDEQKETYLQKAEKYCNGSPKELLEKLVRRSANPRPKITLWDKIKSKLK